MVCQVVPVGNDLTVSALMMSQLRALLGPLGAPDPDLFGRGSSVHDGVGGLGGWPKDHRVDVDVRGEIQHPTDRRGDILCNERMFNAFVNLLSLFFIAETHQ